MNPDPIHASHSCFAEDEAVQYYCEGLINRVIEMQRAADRVAECEAKEKADSAASLCALASVHQRAAEEEVSEAPKGLWAHRDDNGDASMSEASNHTQSFECTDDDELELDADPYADESKTLDDLVREHTASEEALLDSLTAPAKYHQDRGANDTTAEYVQEPVRVAAPKKPTGGTRAHEYVDSSDNEDDNKDMQGKAAAEEDASSEDADDGAYKPKEEDEEETEDDDDEAYVESSDDDKPTRGRFSRPSGARPQLAPKLISGALITDKNHFELHGNHIKGTMACTTKRLDGTILSTRVEREGGEGEPRIMASVQWDCGEVEELTVAGRGRLSRYELPDPQNHIIPFRSAPHGMHYMFMLKGSEAPPLQKISFDDMQPLLILPRADVSKLAEPALSKLLATESYAFYPSTTIESCGTPFFKMGDVHAYSSEVTSNGPRFEYGWVTMGLLVPVISHGLRRAATQCEDGIIVLGYRFKCIKATKAKEASFGYLQACVWDFVACLSAAHHPPTTHHGRV